MRAAMRACGEELHYLSFGHHWRWKDPALGCSEVESFVGSGQEFRPASCALTFLVEKTS